MLFYIRERERLVELNQMFGFKTQLKLNNKQVSLAKQCCSYDRICWNFIWDMQSAAWDLHPGKLSDTDLLAIIKNLWTNSVLKNPENAWMSKLPSTIYQSVFQNFKKAMSRFRKGISEFPVKKSMKEDKKSFTVYKSDGIRPKDSEGMLPNSNLESQCFEGKKVILPGFGQKSILREVRIFEDVDFSTASGSFTISEKNGKWYVAFNIKACRIYPQRSTIEPSKVGIDLGVKAFSTDSDGVEYKLPDRIKELERQIDYLQYRARRKQHGDKSKRIRTSKQAIRFYKKIGRIYAKIARMRGDFIHKTTTSECQKHSEINIETLNVQGMMANHKLARAVGRCGFYEFRRQMTYKQEFYETEVYLIDQWFPSSKTCSSCGHVQDMPLKERTFHCGNCGMKMNRDKNAGCNLRDAPEEKKIRAGSEDHKNKIKKERSNKNKKKSKSKKKSTKGVDKKK